MLILSCLPYISGMPRLIIRQSLIEFSIWELPAYLWAFEPYTILDERDALYYIVAAAAPFELNFDTLLP